MIPRLTTAWPIHIAQSDTLPAKSAQSAKATSRLTPPLMILPGTRLDTSFNALPAQSQTVGKAAPTWLRAKAAGSPMYVVNGKAATAEQLRTLRRADVSSIQVLDGSKAKQLYGKNARNGLVMVTTKKALAP
ncbi:MAG: hypothetical protein JWP57_2568 [Spirosoma sp.]|nr:hypothetical protein [Spirosoma sp.]